MANKLIGPFTKDEKMFLEQAAGEWTFWTEPISGTTSVYYGWRSDWNREQRIVSYKFIDFVKTIDTCNEDLPEPNNEIVEGVEEAYGEYVYRHYPQKFPEIDR